MGKVIYINNNLGGEKMSINENLLSISKVVLFFANNSKRKLYKTKLNKLMFYTQFLYYKLYNSKFIDCEFIKDYHGPVLEDMSGILNLLESAKIISLNEDKYGTSINGLVKLSDDAYSDKQLYVLNKVQDKFQDYTAADISEYSHKESLWENTKLKGYIKLNRAQELNELYD